MYISAVVCSDADNKSYTKQRLGGKYMEDIGRILVVTKSTKYCRKAIHYGVSLARKYGAELTILHVIHNPFGLEGWNLPIPSLPTLEKEYKKMFEDARADLDKMIEMERAKGLPIKELVIEGHPQKKIYEIVEQCYAGDIGS